VTHDDRPHSERLFLVSSAPLPVGEVPVIVPPTNVRLKASCMLKQNGTLSLGARISNSQLGRGEKLTLSLACRNHNAAADIERVGIKIVESFYWEVKSNASKFKRISPRQPGGSSSFGPSADHSPEPPERTGGGDNLNSPNDNANNYMNTVGNGNDNRVSIATGKQALSSASDHVRKGPMQEEHRVLVECPDVNFPLLLQVANQSNHQSLRQCHAAMFEDLKSGKNSISLLIPSDARDTYHGHLLVVAHNVQITVHMKGGRSRSLPTITIPIRVGFPPVYPEAQAVAYTVVVDDGVVASEEYPMDFPVARLQAIPDQVDEDIHASRDNLSSPLPSIRRPPSRRISIGPPFNTELPRDRSSSFGSTRLDTTDVQMRPMAVASQDSFRIGGSSELLEDGEFDESYAYEFGEDSGDDNGGGSYNGGGGGGKASKKDDPSRWRTPPAVSRDSLRISSIEVLQKFDDLSFSDRKMSALTSFASQPDSDISLEGLLQEMAFAVEDFDILSDKLQDPDWSSVFSNLTPPGFGAILAHVSVENDQPRVAELLAGSFAYLSGRGRNRFSCAHVVAALQSSVDFNRPTIVTTLLPYCSDIMTEFPVIQKELNEWEQVITAHEFDEAIAIRANMTESQTTGLDHQSAWSSSGSLQREESKHEVLTTTDYW
jgi:hypothetical protein